MNLKKYCNKILKKAFGFLFFLKTWKVSRKGIYSWTLHENDFKIKKVNILEEKIS
jgi:hypothetical protein